MRSKRATEKYEGARPPAAPSILGSDLGIEGDIVTQGELHISGSVKGDVVARDLTLSEGGSVTGAIESETAIIAGNVAGHLTACSVVLKPTARVAADVTHVSLTIEPGASFQGLSHRVNSIEPSADGAVSSTPSVKSSHFVPGGIHTSPGLSAEKSEITRLTGELLLSSPVSSEAKTTMSEMSNRRQPLAWLPAVGTLLSIFCYGTLGPGLSLMGITLAVNVHMWAVVIVVFALMAGIGLVLGYQLHRSQGALVLGILGALVVVLSIYGALPIRTILGIPRDAVEIVGFASLVAAAIWDWRLKKA